MQDEQFEFIKELLSENNKELREIRIQTTKTNGRVNGLEGDVKVLHDDVEMLKTSKSENKGRDKTIWYVFLAGVAVLWFFVQQFINLKK